MCVLFLSSDGEFTIKTITNLHRVTEAENFGFVLSLWCVSQTQGKLYEFYGPCCVLKVRLTELPCIEMMKLYVYVPSYVECFILCTFKYFLSKIILQLHFVKKSLYTMANMLDEVKDFFIWLNIQKNLLCKMQHVQSYQLILVTVLHC